MLLCTIGFLSTVYQKKLTTDKGSQFLSSEWKDAITFLGMQHIHTTAYHPQSNGLAERTIPNY